MRASTQMAGLILVAFEFLLTTAVFAKTASDHEWQELAGLFVPEYKALNIPEIKLSYVENFNNIQDLAGIDQQQDFFKKYRSRMTKIDRSLLDVENRFQHDALLYEINLNLDRLRLERRFRSEQSDSGVPTNGIIHVPHNRQWYRYYVRHWTSTNITPEELLKFGESEVTRVNAEIESIQKEVGYENDADGFYQHLNDPSFLVTDETELINSFTSIRDSMMLELGTDFADTNIPVVDIKLIQNPNQDTPPGYYEDGIFYFNFYQNRFRKRNLEWLFIHEAVPGHHYQLTVKANYPPIRQLFWYSGFTEGWAAYSENLGKDLGRYEDIYQYLGKWEWDLVRSARIVLDVGLNYLGWSKDTARTYWQTHIANQDDIMNREIDRVIRWPAQALTYKVGEKAILDLRRKSEERLGEGFDLKAFHENVLGRGPIPVVLLESNIKRNDHDR